MFGIFPLILNYIATKRQSYLIQHFILLSLMLLFIPVLFPYICAFSSPTLGNYLNVNSFNKNVKLEARALYDDGKIYLLSHMK